MRQAPRVSSARLRALEERGRALAQFIARVRERGDVPEIEEIDLVMVRVEFILERAALRAMATRGAKSGAT